MSATDEPLRFGAQQPVRLAVRIALDPALVGIGRVPGVMPASRNATVLTRSVLKKRISTTGCSDVAGSMSCRVGSRPSRKLPSFHPCPTIHSPGGVHPRTLAHQLHHLLGRPALIQPDLRQLDADLQQVDVAVEQAGDDRAAAEVDNLRAGPGERCDLRILAHGQDPIYLSPPRPTPTDHRHPKYGRVHCAE